MENDLRWNNNNSWVVEISPIFAREVKYLSQELFDEYISRDKQGRQTFYESLACVPVFVFEWHVVQGTLDSIEEEKIKDYKEYKKIVHNHVMKRVHYRVSNFCVHSKTELSFEQVASLYRVARLFIRLNSFLSSPMQLKTHRHRYPPLMIDEYQRDLFQHYKKIKNFKPTQEEITLISIAYDELEKATDEAEKFKNAKMLWDFLLDQGLAKECIYVKGNRLPGAGFSKQ